MTGKVALSGKYQAYPEYKDSGVEWLGDIPISWIALPIKMVSKIFNGATPKSGVAPFWDGDIPWVTPADLGKSVSPYISKGSRSITAAGYNSCGVSLVPKNSIILASRAPIGTLGIASNDLCTNQGCKSLVVKDRFVPEFLYYVLLSSTEQLNLLGRGSTFLELSADDLGSYKIPSPSECEQQKIASFLDHETAKIDTLIDKQQQLIQLLKEKRQAVISHAVTKGLNPNAPMRDSGVEWLGEVPEHWVLARLKNVLRIRNGRDYKDVEVEEGGYPVYGSGGIFKRSSSYLYDGKSVLFGRKGTIDKPLVVSGKFWTVDTMFYSEVFDNVLPEYIYYQATFFPFNLLSTNTALPSMTQEDLLMLPFVVPPRIEQEGIIKYVQDKSARFDNLIGKAQSAIELMQERRTALISAAVTGKIDVRDWQVPALMQNKEAV